MRPSSRVRILDAAVRVVDREEGGTISFEAVAVESGLSKAGILYHFPSRDDLMLGLSEHVVKRWESAFMEALPVPFESSTVVERVRAYVSSLSGLDVSKADFAVYSEALHRPAYAKAWLELHERWFALPDHLSPDVRSRLHSAKLAADGLWVAEATGFGAPGKKEREAVISEILSLTEVPRSEKDTEKVEDKA